MVAVAYRRWLFTRGSNCKALTGKILVFWIGGRLREVVAHGGLTVVTCCSRNMPACLRSHENTKKKMPVFQASAKKTSLHQPLIRSHFSFYRQLELLEYYPGPRGFFFFYFSSRKRERAAKKIFKKKNLGLTRVLNSVL